jgi:hypothetical protein
MPNSNTHPIIILLTIKSSCNYLTIIVKTAKKFVNIPGSRLRTFGWIGVCGTGGSGGFSGILRAKRGKRRLKIAARYT